MLPLTQYLQIKHKTPSVFKGRYSNTCVLAPRLWSQLAKCTCGIYKCIRQTKKIQYLYTVSASALGQRMRQVEYACHSLSFNVPHFKYLKIFSSFSSLFKCHPLREVFPYHPSKIMPLGAWVLSSKLPCFVFFIPQVNI